MMQSIKVEQDFNKPVNIVWETITQVDHMTNWFFDSLNTFEAEIGFETQFDVLANGKIFTHLWKLTEVLSMKKITYNWRYLNYPGNSFVTFELNERKNGTRLTLTHEIVEPFPNDIPEFSRESCAEGWNYFIRNSLKEYIERT